MIADAPTFAHVSGQPTALSYHLEDHSGALIIAHVLGHAYCAVGPCPSLQNEFHTR